MKNFYYYRAESFADAADYVKHGSRPLAGGTDLLGGMKTAILPEYPDSLVSLLWIPGADGIYINGNSLYIGATAKLSDIAEDKTILDAVPILAEAAHSVASPNIRNRGTIGGNLCQDVRCWFYRYPHEGGGRMVCARKGGDTCYAIQGDNRYHSIFGGMKTHATPCSQHCPASTDIPAYMEQLRKGNKKAAARILMQANPMPMLTSRVCAHFCQSGCNRGHTDDSVAIREVERSVGDYILENGREFYAPPQWDTGKAIAIVGAGPSGLSAAFYLRKAGHRVTVYDARPKAGGMLMYAIPNYRLPKQLVRTFTELLQHMGISFVLDTTIGQGVTPADLEKQYDSVYYAPGTWKRPTLGIPGEELTMYGLDFLVDINTRMEGKIGNRVLVAGGGNVAMDVAITARRLGAQTVILACLESEEEMPAGRDEVARAREEGIIIMPQWGLDKVLADNGVVTGMRLKRCVAVRDAKGAFNPHYDDSEKKDIAADNILMAVGQAGDLSFLDEKYDMQLTRRGLIGVDAGSQMTSRRGVFAGGDIVTGPSTVINAVATGHSASRSINRYLGCPENYEGNVDKANEATGIQFLSLEPSGIKKYQQARLTELPVAARNIKKEDAFSLPMDQALAEAARCLNCGCYAVNPSDLAPVLMVLDARIHTTQRIVPADEFCGSTLKVTDFLAPGELVESIEIPLPKESIGHYDKFRLRDAIDFAIVSLASLFTVQDGKITKARLVMGGVAPVPLRCHAGERYLLNKKPDAQIAEAVAELAVNGAIPLDKNRYKINEIKGLIKTAVLRLQNARE